MRINIVSNIFGSSGYAIHARSLANALNDIGCDVRIDSPKHPGWERQVSDSELVMLTKEYDKDCCMIFIGTPNFWKFGLAEDPKHFIGFLVWEGDVIPKYWLNIMKDKRIDSIFVPSTHVEKAILNTNNECNVELPPVHITPHGVNLNIFKPEILDTKTDTFVISVNKGWSKGKDDRGGMQYIIQAYLEEFTNKDNIQLEIKLNPAYCGPEWDFKNEIDKLGLKKQDDSPNLLINTEYVDFKVLSNIYNRANIFVSPTMAEAFNLPCLEAMACGIPVITTNFGGQTDFVNEKNGWLIDYKLVDSQEKPMYEGVKWARPNIEKLKTLLRFAYENKDIIVEKGKIALEDSSKYTWTNTANKINEIIKKIGSLENTESGV